MINALQAALDAIDTHVAENDFPDKLIVRAKVRAILRAYDQIWGPRNRLYIVRDAERLLVGPLVNMKTRKPSEYKAAGKLDVFMDESTGLKRTILMDHKLLASSFDENDIEHLMIAGQPNQYAYLGWTHGIRFSHAVWDIIVKPTHRPSKERSKIVRPAREERVAARKTTVGEITYAKGETIPAQEEIRETTPAETLEEFEQRVYEIMVEDKDRFFARPEAPIHAHNIGEHVHELYMWTMELDIDSKSDIHLRNTNSCMDYNSACEYLSLCSGRSHENDGTWELDPHVHKELELAEGENPFKIITNSRISTFKACRLKHHRKYNMGLQKRNKKIAEPLYVGTVGHIGLEYYWKALQGNQGVTGTRG